MPVVLGVSGASAITLLAIWAPLKAGVARVRSTEL
jgi:hypothetical protein